MASASELDRSLNITLSFTLNIEIKLLTFRTSEATSYVESGEESLSKQVPTYQLRKDCILRNFDDECDSDNCVVYCLEISSQTTFKIGLVTSFKSGVITRVNVLLWLTNI